MTSLEEHKKNVQQFIDDINEKIKADLLVERQKIIAFAASEAATNLLEYYLHKKEVISPGFKVNHRYFSSEKRAERYLDFPFSKKSEIISCMIQQEELRDLLCYGKQKKREKVEDAISNLMKLKSLVMQELGEEL